ncbi:MAG: hypothetical protein OEU26_26570 [Candidatus Tectomicrobia bacterium]|nr:hypothetical protein [Candidatus Tectomicrobia bacterium]
MKFDAKVDGVKELRRKFKNYPQLVDQEVVVGLKIEARALAIEYGFNTVPFGFGEETRSAHGKRIEKEVRWMFPSIEDPGHVYRVLRQVDVGMAAEFWRAHKQGDRAKMEKVLRRRTIPKGVDRGTYERRRNKGGYVPYQALPVAVVTAGRQASFAKEKKKTIGIAKAGWLQAAKAIGGRVRRQGKEAFPKYVRAASRLVAGLGGAEVVEQGRFPSVTIYSEVRYAERALDSIRKHRAEVNAERRSAETIRKRLEHLNKKLFKGRKLAG